MFNTRKLKFQENISGAQITCHAQPDNNMNPEITKFMKFNKRVVRFEKLGRFLPGKCINLLTYY